jgi:hypothetical protein
VFKFTSTRLVDHLNERARSLRGGNPGAALAVPDELRWWYYHEFGTFGGYPIRAKDGGMLKLPPNGEFGLFHNKVIHPGVRAKHFLKKIIPEIDAYAFAEMKKALVETGYNIEAVKAILIERIMPKVADMIAESMSQSLHASDNPGSKLHGEDPATVYRDNVQIVEPT